MTAEAAISSVNILYRAAYMGEEHQGFQEKSALELQLQTGGEMLAVPALIF